MPDDRTRKRFKANLRAAFRECADPDVMMSRDEVRRLGVPESYAASIVRASHAVASAQDADEAADETADYIFDKIDRLNSLNTDEIVKRVGRL